MRRTFYLTSVRANTYCSISNSMDFIRTDDEAPSSASGLVEANMARTLFSNLSLKEQLQAAMVEEFSPSAPTSLPRRKFLPRDQIEALINRGSVQQELTRSAPHIPRVIRDIYTKAVCSTRRRFFRSFGSHRSNVPDFSLHGKRPDRLHSSDLFLRRRCQTQLGTARRCHSLFRRTPTPSSP